MREIGIPKLLINTVEEFYERNRVSMKLKNSVYVSFTTTLGFLSMLYAPTYIRTDTEMLAEKVCGNEGSN